jgi:hypothetical protein
MTTFFYEEKRRNHNVPAFKEIRKVKKKCEECNRFGVIGICHKRVLCRECWDKEKEKIKGKKK